MAGLLLHRILGRGPPIAQNGSSRTLRLTPSSPWGVPMKITGNMLGGLLQAGTLIWVGLSSLLIHVWIELNLTSLAGKAEVHIAKRVTFKPHSRSALPLLFE